MKKYPFASYMRPKGLLATIAYHKFLHDETLVRFDENNDLFRMFGVIANALDRLEVYEKLLTQTKVEADERAKNEHDLL